MRCMSIFLAIAYLYHHARMIIAKLLLQNLPIHHHQIQLRTTENSTQFIQTLILTQHPAL
jgi:hypothetical protein